MEDNRMGNLIYSQINAVTGKLESHPAAVTKKHGEHVADLWVMPKKGRAFRVSHARLSKQPSDRHYSHAISSAALRADRALERVATKTQASPESSTEQASTNL